MTTLLNAPCGRIQGVEDRGAIAYRGIPYAAAPVGRLRFRPPERVAPWEGTFDATQFGPVPYQTKMPGVFGELATPIQPSDFDSLRLNVWTPADGGGGLPVIVWIHGGAYYAGSGSDEIYNGAHFARDGVVCVTVNYRLGAEGFLHLGGFAPGFEDSGCSGIADQIAALHWVQDNIAAFGGDPAKVTIAGESAGGMSVGVLMATPSATGLFHRAIPQSGVSFRGVSAATGQLIAGQFLERAGISAGDVVALQGLAPERVLEIQAAMLDELTMTRDVTKYGDAAATGMAFQPTFGTPLLPQVPLDAVADGSAADVELLLGSNHDEALLFIKALSDIFNEDLVRESLVQVMEPAGRDGGEAFRRYVANRPGAAPYEIAAAVETDRLFRIPAIRLAEAQLRHQPAVYMYRFDWPSAAFDGGMGAFHFLEIAFTFDNLDLPMAQDFTGPAPQQLADDVHRAWVGFVTDGRPDHERLSPWPRYDTARRATMVLHDACKVVDDPDPSERELWDGVL